MADPRTARPEQPGLLGPALLAAVATLVSMWPYTGVVQPGVWTTFIVAVVVITALTGMFGRGLFGRLRGGIRDLLTAVVQIIALTITCTALLASETAVAGIIPTSTTAQLVGLRVQRAVEEITTGVAPITSTLSIATVLGIAFAVVSLLIDHLVVGRVIILSVLFTSIVGIVPMLLSFGSVNIVWFLMQAVVILLLLRYGARRDPHAPRQSRYLLAGFTGAAVIALTVIATPVLPLTSALPGTGPMLTVSADLRLGDDLRRPEGVEALTLITSAARPPYLRMATLSKFDGEIWRPDRAERQPLSQGFGEQPWVDGIETVTNQVSIRVLGVSSDRLPLPYAAERVTGVSSSWQAMPLNRTVLSRSEDASGADYTVSAVTPVPTLEQIRVSRATGAQFVGPPAAELPPLIGELAREVTADARTDYDKLLALQNWFRSEFSYSLDAPVEDGFDGTGADAVVKFLEERTGYCVHFAGAFALMAQSLDMPVRIVVGYLPGTDSGQKKGPDTIWTVSSDQLHSWPEVFFTGIGWVPFEPTATLGTPTEFVAATPDDDDGDDPQAPQPTATSSADPSAGPSLQPDEQDQGLGSGSDLDRLDPTPVMMVTLGIVVVLLLPALWRRLQRMRRVGRARQGDAMAAWRELADTLVDLGWPVSDADTARTRAQNLVSMREVSADAIRTLVDAVERSSYSAEGAASGDLSADLRKVLTQLESGVETPRRIRALLLPSSLRLFGGRYRRSVPSTAIRDR